MDEKSQPTKRRGKWRNRAHKTNIASEADWSDLERLASLDEVISFELSGVAISELSTILMFPLTDLELLNLNLNEIATDYLHHQKQGVPSKAEAREQLQCLAKVSSRLAVSAFPDPSVSLVSIQ